MAVYPLAPKQGAFCYVFCLIFLTITLISELQFPFINLVLQGHSFTYDQTLSDCHDQAEGDFFAPEINRRRCSPSSYRSPCALAPPSLPIYQSIPVLRLLIHLTSCPYADWDHITGSWLDNRRKHR